MLEGYDSAFTNSELKNNPAYAGIRKGMGNVSKIDTGKQKAKPVDQDTLKRLTEWKDRLSAQIESFKDAPYDTPAWEQGLSAIQSKVDVQSQIDKLTGEKTKDPYVFQGEAAKTKTVQFTNRGTLTVPIADAERASSFEDTFTVRHDARGKINSLRTELSELQSKYAGKRVPRSYYTRVAEIQTELRNLMRYKNYANVPNFASADSKQAAAIASAYSREASSISALLGQSPSNVSVSHGFDRNLISSSNPMGAGVFSPSVGQSSLRDAMKDHQKPARNLAVPNFAPESTIDSEILDSLNSSISELINSISSLSNNASGGTSSSGGTASVNIPISVSVSSAGEGSMPQGYYDSLKSEVESTVSRVNAIYADLIKSRSIAPIAPSRNQVTPVIPLGVRG